jgi:TolB protein
MKTVRNSLLIFALICWSAIAIEAQVVVSKNFQKRSFAVTGFAGDPTIAAQLTEVLKSDVRLSGYLALTPSADAEFVQQGTVRGDRGGITVECFVTQTATKKSVLSKSYPGSTQDLRRLAHVIADDIVQAVTGQRGIAQTKIAFVISRGPAVKELAVMDYDGHNVRLITNDRKISVHPRWSPDGRKIIYTSYLQTFVDVLEADLYTNQRRRIAAFPGLNSGAEFSPNGLTIALTLSKDGNPELYTMNASGGGLRRLTQTAGAESSPTWSPDGQSIAYVSDERGSPQVYLIGREGGDPTRLTVSPAYNTEPNWSHPAPGSGVSPMLAVTSRVGGKFQIGLYDSATREVRPVVADGTDNEDPSWAPNGRFLVFAKTQSWRSRLYLLDVLTGEQVELPAVEGGTSEPAWGPWLGGAK